eukprot:GHVR01168104.1.p1 GENE.GHVR01168104.1~~GHVR01168104.1.p1  ORF type:complete len:169 (+),score=22.51 GHVR01168104.1:731-1237(+)
MGVTNICGITVHCNTMYVTSWADEGSVYYKSLEEADSSEGANILVSHTETHPLLYPDGIAVSHDIIAVCCTNGPYIQIYNKQGHPLTTITDSTGGRRFKPWGLTLDTHQHILVCDHNNQAIKVYNTEGSILKTIKTDHEKPGSLCLSPKETLWVGYYDDSNTVCEYQY